MQIALMGVIDAITSLRTPTSNVNSLSLDGSDGDMLPAFVSEAHAHVSKGESSTSTIEI